MNVNETLSASVIAEVKRGIGHMFYVVDREEMSYQTPEQVPNIFQQVSAYLPSQYPSMPLQLFQK